MNNGSHHEYDNHTHEIDWAWWQASRRRSSLQGSSLLFLFLQGLPRKKTALVIGSLSVVFPEAMHDSLKICFSINTLRGRKSEPQGLDLVGFCFHNSLHTLHLLRYEDKEAFDRPH